jgi:hypothetical protein
MKQLLVAILLSLLSIGCSKPVVSAAPPTPLLSQTSEYVPLAVALKNFLAVTGEQTSSMTIQSVSTNDIAPPSVYDCPTSGTIEQTIDLNEETFEFIFQTRANMCRDGENLIDGYMYTEAGGIRFQNLMTREISWCDYLTSTMNGTITTSGTHMSSANMSISYSEGPGGLVDHTFTLTSEMTYATNTISATGSIVRDDGLTLTYTMTTGTEYDPVLCDRNRGYLQFALSDGTIVRYQDGCEGGFPKLLINGEEVDEEFGCT